MVEVEALPLKLITCAKPAFAVRNECLLLLEGHGVESNSPLHVAFHNLPQVVTWSREALFKIFVGSNLRFRNPDRPLHNPIFRHVYDGRIVLYHWESTGVIALPANPLSHFTNLHDGPESEPDPTIEATGEPLGIHGLTIGTLPPTTTIVTGVRRHLLFSHKRIGIFASGRRGVSLNLPIYQARVVQHPLFARVDGRDDVRPIHLLRDFPTKNLTPDLVDCVFVTL